MRGSRQRNDGVALILALLFIALLTVLIVEFSFESQVEGSYAANQGSDFGAYLAAKSAIAKSLGLLESDIVAMDMAGGTTVSGSSTTPTSPNRNTIKNTTAGNNAVMDMGPPVDSLMDPWAMGVPFEPLNEDATMRGSISDEYGKINLNALLDISQDTPKERPFVVEALRAFFRDRTDDSEKAADMIVDSILDWVDYNDDDQEHTEGAENDYYNGLESPFPCKNGPMDTIEELLLIKGMTPDIYFGDPEREQLPLSEYLTVHGDWLGRVNINTALPEVIASFMAANPQGGDFDYSQAEQIHEEVQEQPIVDQSELSRYPGTQGLMISGDGAPVPGAPGTVQGGGGFSQDRRRGNDSLFDEDNRNRDRKPGTNTKPSPGTQPGRTRPRSQSGGLFGKADFLDAAKPPETMASLAPLVLESTLGQAGSGGSSGGVNSGGVNSGGVNSGGVNSGGVNSGGVNNGGVGGAQPGNISAWRTTSNVFRIYGDGMEGDVMVRIEAYVWRTPLEPDETMMAMEQMGGAQANPQVRDQTSKVTTDANELPMEATTMPAETFRILDWKIIR